MVEIPSVDDCVCISVSFAVWLRRPAPGAAVSWVMPGLVYKWLPLWEFSLSDTP